MSATATTIAALGTMLRCLPEAADQLEIALDASFAHWSKTVTRKLLPRLSADFPLVAAICGGGSTGKSTLFNHLTGKRISPTGGRAGLNRRVVMAIHDDQTDLAHCLEAVAQAFGTTPRPVRQPEQLLEPGPPLYSQISGIPRNVILLDSPDIDTGARGVYTNRELAQQSLEVADLFIYIFTNTTYNNLDNTDFIARMLTGMGQRPCFLVYRTYANVDDHEILEHADVVATNIYGTPHTDLVLGVYRADEHNAVAAGEAALRLHAVNGNDRDLGTALGEIDTAALRSRLFKSMVGDAVRQGIQHTEGIRREAQAVREYRRALIASQDASIRMSLSHFPTDQVLRRFAKIWVERDPVHIKLMRRTGSAVQWPMRAVVRTIGRIKGTAPHRAPDPADDALDQKVEMDLLEAANRLHDHAVSDQIPSVVPPVPAPPLVLQERTALAKRSWEQALDMILGQKETVLNWSRRLDDDLKQLADDLRSRMGWRDQVRQTFAALLNVIPATAAVTYILHTGDPVGAAGIKVKLTGLFGLHDLYALIAIPATAGLSKADRGQLEQLLAPLARTWLEHKSGAVRTLFEQHITGDILKRMNTALERVDAQIEALDAAIESIDTAQT